MSGRVGSVAVVGRDAPLWLVASALQRALGRTGLRVHAVELNSRLSNVDAYVALPTLGALHRLLGLDERLVLEVCHAVPMVGQRFSNWARSAPPYLLAYDAEPPSGELPFVQYWLKGAQRGLRVSFDDFSLGNVTARLNAVPMPGDEPQELAAAYGYQLDAPAYAELTKQLALRLGVEVASSGLSNVDADGDWISALELSDGTRLEADLFIDASGREARLLKQLPGAEFESWSRWLPCNRMLSASGPRLAQLPAFSQVSAFAGGWVAQYPLQSRTAVTAVYKSSTITDDEVVELAGIIARTPIKGDAVITEMKPGIQRKPWIGNCIAMGEAAIAVDPIDAVDLQATHGCISHLMQLFPATAGDFPEADAYNRTIRLFGANLRDFQATHYLLNRRFDEPMWDAIRETEPPPSLKRRIDMFAARAAVPLNDEETFQEPSWAALMLGCGVQPESYDPRVDAVPDDIHVGRVQQRLRDVVALARKMPSVEQFLGVEQRTAVMAGE